MHVAETYIEKNLYSLWRCIVQINRTIVYQFHSNFIEVFSKE